MTDTPMRDRSTAPLAGVRVIEVGLFHAGPIATAMLGALGAEVIKIEDPKKGDPVRSATSIYGQDSSFLNDRSAAFEAYNSGKKSVILDMSKSEGRRVLHALVAKSDIFLHNMRAETATKLEIDFEALVRHNPKLVYASVSGFGPDGADSRRPGLDPVGMARSGLMSVVSGGSHMRPFLTPAGIADRMAGLLAACGILACLQARDHTGKPQKVESSLLGGAMWLGHLNLQIALFKGFELLPPAPETTPLFTTYKCADGRWLFISVLDDAAWPPLCVALDKPSLVSDPKFIDATARKTNRGDLAILLEQTFAAKTSKEWEIILATQPALIFQAVNTPTEIGDDPQILANEYIVAVDHPEKGPIKRMALPLHHNGKPLGGFLDPSPRHGESSSDVLASVLGMTADEIKALQASGITRDAAK